MLAPEGSAEVVLLADGLVSVFLGARPIENLKPGGFFGEETLMRGARELPPDWQQAFPQPSARGAAGSRVTTSSRPRAAALRPVAVAAEVIEDIPVMQWKLMETYERRLKSIRAEVQFVSGMTRMSWGSPRSTSSTACSSSMIDGSGRGGRGPVPRSRGRRGRGKLVALPART